MLHRQGRDRGCTGRHRRADQHQLRLGQLGADGANTKLAPATTDAAATDRDDLPTSSIPAARTSPGLAVRPYGWIQCGTVRSVLSEELLTHLYNDKQLTLREIGLRFGCSQSQVGRLRAEYGVTRRETQRLSGIVVKRDWLYDQYVNHRRTLPDLAREVGMSTSNMSRWARIHNIPIRSRGGGSHDQVRVTLDQATTAPSVLRPALSGRGGWEQLRRFSATAEHPTIGAAAAALELTASTLVTQINRLERDLRGQLLTRAERGQSMLLTPLGRKVVAAVRRHSFEEMSGN